MGLQGGKGNQTSKQVYENGKVGFCEEKRQNSSEIKGKTFKPKNQKHIIQIMGKYVFKLQKLGVCKNTIQTNKQEEQVLTGT